MVQDDGLSVAEEEGAACIVLTTFSFVAFFSPFNAHIMYNVPIGDRTQSTF